MAEASLSVKHLLERQRHDSRRCLRRCIENAIRTAGVEIKKYTNHHNLRSSSEWPTEDRAARGSRYIDRLSANGLGFRVSRLFTEVVAFRGRMMRQCLCGSCGGRRACSEGCSSAGLWRPDFFSHPAPFMRRRNHPNLLLLGFRA